MVKREGGEEYEENDDVDEGVEKEDVENTETYPGQSFGGGLRL